jgi:hypothetical protein
LAETNADLVICHPINQSKLFPSLQHHHYTSSPTPDRIIFVQNINMFDTLSMKWNLGNPFYEKKSNNSRRKSLFSLQYPRDTANTLPRPTYLHHIRHMCTYFLPLLLDVGWISKYFLELMISSSYFLYFWIFSVKLINVFLIVLYLW